MSEILYDERDGIAYITLNRPEARNALTFEMYEEIARLCSEIKLGGAIKSVIINGAGDKAFAAGTSMDQFRSFCEPQHSIGYEKTMDDVLQRIEQCEVPTIAALTGACTGGGAAIAAACDLRICDERLEIWISDCPHTRQLPFGREFEPDVCHTWYCKGSRNYLHSTSC